MVSREPVRDLAAGALIRQWRLDKGLSPEALSWSIAVGKLGHISGRQIRRIEEVGIIPTPRVQFALAKFFETTPTRIWEPPKQTAGARR